jgi:predicted component of type VI protein secretion system
MTFTITTENLYLAIIALFMIIQIYQWKAIYKIKSEIDSVWKQIHLLTMNVAAEILKLKKDPDEKAKQESA